MNQFRVSTAARPDLDDIWFYIARDNLAAADKFIHAIVAKFPKLAAWPQIGRLREELSPQLRSLVAGRHVILKLPRWPNPKNLFLSPATLILPTSEIIHRKIMRASSSSNCPMPPSPRM